MAKQLSIRHMKSLYSDYLADTDAIIDNLMEIIEDNPLHVYSIVHALVEATSTETIQKTLNMVRENKLPVAEGE